MTHNPNAPMDRRSPRTGVDDQAAKILSRRRRHRLAAAAAFLIRDGDVIGRNITILEESDVIGGSLDGAGSADEVTCSGAAACSRANTSALSSCSPRSRRSTRAGRSRRRCCAWNETMKTSSKSRLMIDGRRVGRAPRSA